MSAKVLVDERVSDGLAAASPDTPSLLLGTRAPPRILHIIPLQPPPPAIAAHHWAAHHARSLATACPGGVRVLGIALAPSPRARDDAALLARDDAALLARAAVDGAAEALEPVDVRQLAEDSATDADADAFVLLAGRRPALKRVAAAAGAGADAAAPPTRSADVRVVPHLAVADLVAVSARVALSARASAQSPARAEICAAQNVDRLLSGVAVSLAAHGAPAGAKRTLVVDEADMAALDAFLAERPRRARRDAQAGGATMDVRVLLPVGASTGVEVEEEGGDKEGAAEGGDCKVNKDEEGAEGGGDCKVGGEKELDGGGVSHVTVSVAGTLVVRAVVMRDATRGQLLRAVREDLLRSWRARRRLQRELDDDDDEPGGEDVPDADADTDADVPARLPQDVGQRALPVRVSATSTADPASRAPFSFAEYCAPGETLYDDVAARLADVLSWDEDQLAKHELVAEEELAVVAVRPVTRAVPEVARLDMKQIEGDDEGQEEMSPVMLYGMGLAVLLAVLAIIVKQVL